MEARAPGQEVVPAPFGADAELALGTPGRVCVAGAAAPRPFLGWHPHEFLGSWPFKSQPKASVTGGTARPGTAPVEARAGELSSLRPAEGCPVAPRPWVSGRAGVGGQPLAPVPLIATREA